MSIIETIYGYFWLNKDKSAREKSRKYGGEYDKIFLYVEGVSHDSGWHHYGQ